MKSSPRAHRPASRCTAPAPSSRDRLAGQRVDRPRRGSSRPGTRAATSASARRRPSPRAAPARPAPCASSHTSSPTRPKHLLHVGERGAMAPRPAPRQRRCLGPTSRARGRGEVAACERDVAAHRRQRQVAAPPRGGARRAAPAPGPAPSHSSSRAEQPDQPEQRSSWLSFGSCASVNAARSAEIAARAVAVVAAAARLGQPRAGDRRGVPVGTGSSRNAGEHARSPRRGRGPARASAMRASSSRQRRRGVLLALVAAPALLQPCAQQHAPRSPPPRSPAATPAIRRPRRRVAAGSWSSAASSARHVGEARVWPKGQAAPQRRGDQGRHRQRPRARLERRRARWPPAPRSRAAGERPHPVQRLVDRGAEAVLVGARVGRATAATARATCTPACRGSPPVRRQQRSALLERRRPRPPRLAARRARPPGRSRPRARARRRRPARCRA